MNLNIFLWILVLCSMCDFIITIDNSGLKNLIKIECWNPKTRNFSEIFLNDIEITKKLDLKQRTGFIIHGWESDSKKEIGFVLITKYWIKYFNNNICKVDWSLLAKGNYVKVADVNVKLTSNYISTILNDLNKNYNYSFDNIILAGHSLGAHISGFIGKKVNGKISEIYAFDPAGPLFSYPVQVSEKERLSKNDANFVQVIHTSIGTTGFILPLGHQDIYINGGFAPQPGCVWPLLVQPSYIDPIRCSHSRSMQYFADSIINPEKCIITKCESYVKYQLNLCLKNNQDQMGFQSKRIPGTYFMSTGYDPVCTGK